MATDHNQAPSDDEVKERCWDQREALPGEPICAVCGRYGEYICDETDDDICSLECKQSLLSRLSKSKASREQPSPAKLLAMDECYYVRDGNNESEPRCLSNSQTELLRRKLEISVQGDNTPDLVLSFASCNLPHKLLLNLEAAGYEMLTPVQMQAIPSALLGHSLLVSAETGSGKTCSFLVPVISHCTKVEEQAKLLGQGLPFKTALIVGGDAMAGQVHRIQQGVSMIVGTPGRLIDLLTKHEFELDSISILVIDEVDCMIERGFREQVMQIFLALSRPQVLMYSATISKEVERVAGSMVKDLAVISVGKPSKPSKAVKQLAIWVESNKKKQKLFDILTSKQHFKPPVVVFVGSRLGADLLSEAITIKTGVKAVSIHGEKKMERRDILRSFLVGEVSVIVATGVLGRGIDLLSVRLVIVFDMPNSMKEYVHQIGRASRMGEDGAAMVFVNEENKKLIPELVELLTLSGASIPRELAIANSRCSVSTSKSHKKRKYAHSR
ncbi:DEAD-box ATP-dependent RNA helicase 41-like isoform X2 [Salvia splendens]|uniref:DEAD-box ATP-dependent RNA helicase 41-like isoform X2 n=1 Tax=Salvia splendens TaxID=180675 RepID=UPI001C259B4D|nr:DEAD-box ATP-dependent RNA helicase 41-like isoform X2 [Salvia splendens]